MLCNWFSSYHNGSKSIGLVAKMDQLLWVQSKLIASRNDWSARYRRTVAVSFVSFKSGRAIFFVPRSSIALYSYRAVWSAAWINPRAAGCSWSSFMTTKNWYRHDSIKHDNVNCSFGLCLKSFHSRPTEPAAFAPIHCSVRCRVLVAPDITKFLVMKFYYLHFSLSSV